MAPPAEAVAHAEEALREEPDEQPLPIDETDEGDNNPEAASQEAPANEGEATEAEPEPAVDDTAYPLEAVAYQFITNIVERPAPGSRVIGYLRRGARVRVSERVRGRGCQRGWHEVEGGGFVCHADGVIVGESPDPWPDAPVAATLDQPLPYTYYSAVRDHVPEYWERPSSDQEAQVAAVIRRLRTDETTPPVAEEATDAGVSVDAGGDAGVVVAVDAAPSEEAADAGLPTPARMLLARGFIVSVSGTEGRWIRTVRGRFVDRTLMTEREPHDFQGVELGAELTLPVAFVVRGRAKALRPRGGSTLRFEVAGTLKRLSALPVLGEVVRNDQRYLSIGKRLLARADILAVAEPIERPPNIGPDERWIDICLSSQTLVAYEGDQPVYATLVSTGRSADGFATPTGTFHILTKHVATTMDDPNGGDEAYSIEDVPWTMYFHESYALHAAFWHNNFGRERSHGCVNLSPADARWIFFWSTPSLPPGWHGVRAGTDRPGTAVVIRP